MKIERKISMDAGIDANFGDAVQEKLKWLANLSTDSAGGVSRLLYSPEWVETQAALWKLFNQERLTAYFDEIGNLFGRIEGTTYKNETILTGSHIDTVKNGGMYDGQYGIIAGFLALNYLQEKHGPPLRNIEVVSMAEEEGSRFPYTFWGSKNIVGQANVEDVIDLKDSHGISFDEAIHKAGFDYKKNQEATIRDDLKSFVEVHVEQGNILETEKVPVGIVEHIVGQRRFTITVNGQANHAGTTPMRYRKDAMNAAARMITAINDLAFLSGDPLVATVGSMTLEPNSVNVIPSKAIFTLDLRHIEKGALINFTTDLKTELNKIATQNGVGIDIDMYMDAEPVPMDQDIVKVIREQCDNNNLRYKMMHSGAGHDSQIMAPVIPTAMIFVPSHNGISHSPSEFTEPDDLGAGVKALIGALYEMGYKK